MKFIGIFLFALSALLSVDCLTLQQVKDGEVFARDCIFKIGISPLAINRLRKGDFSRVDEKSHVSFLHYNVLRRNAEPQCGTSHFVCNIPANFFVISQKISTKRPDGYAESRRKWENPYMCLTNWIIFSAS